MMNDDKTPMDDEFDDLDFEDLDDDLDADLESDDAFEDESWDEFDDSEGDVATDENPAADTPDVAPAAANAGERTFIQKYFNLIVIAVAVLGGGAFLMMKFGGSSAPIAPSPTEMADPLQATSEADSLASAEPIDALGDDLPPMPAPIDTVEDSATPLSDSAIEEIEMATQDDVLTPMPEDSANNDVELAPLEDVDAVLEDVAELPTDIQFEDEMDEALPELGDVEPFVPVEAEEEPVLELPGEASDQDLALMEDEGMEPVIDLSQSETEGEEPTIDDFAADSSIESEDGETAFEIDAEPMAEAPMQETPAADTEAVSAMEATIAELTDKVENQAQAIEAARGSEEALRSELETANEKIAALEAQLKDAQTQEKAPQPAETSEKEAETAPAEPAAQAPKPEKKAENPAPAVQKPQATPEKITWRLRSVGRNQATLVSQDGNFLQVEIGDTVQGLGKIQTISQQGGKWVVQGTTGSVTQ